VQAAFGTKYNSAAGVDFTQLLFDGQVFVGLRARSAALDFSTKQIAVTEEMINVNVQKIYYQLVVGAQQETTIDVNIDRFEKLLKETQEIYKQGFAEKLDIDKGNSTIK
jgi:outer membrane protein TolC